MARCRWARRPRKSHRRARVCRSRHCTRPSNGDRRRQKLLALSDVERSQVYRFEGVPPLPIWDFEATIRVTPIVDGDRAFVEWFASFDCYPEGQDERIAFFRDAFAGWLGSLRRHLQRQAQAA